MMTEKNTQAKFSIAAIYVKDCSFEAPLPISAYGKQDWNPNADVNIQVNNSAAANSQHEVIVSVNLKVTLEDKTVFIVELQQAGLFTIAGVEGEKLNQVLRAYCPSIIFPYLRQNVSDMITRAGFPPLYLSPIDFDAQYLASQKQEAQETTN